MSQIQYLIWRFLRAVMLRRGHPTTKKPWQPSMHSVNHPKRKVPRYHRWPIWRACNKTTREHNHLMVMFSRGHRSSATFSVPTATATFARKQAPDTSNIVEKRQSWDSSRRVMWLRITDSKAARNKRKPGREIDKACIRLYRRPTRTKTAQWKRNNPIVLPEPAWKHHLEILNLDLKIWAW